MTIKAIDIKSGDLVKDLGLIHSSETINGKIQFKLIPFNLEYYGIELSTEFESDKIFELIQSNKIDKYIAYCFKQINSAEKHFNEALIFYTEWKKTNKKSKNKFKSRKLKNLCVGDLTSSGLVADKCKSWLHEDSRRIKLLSSKNFQIFSFCYIVDINDIELQPNGFEKRTKILNDDFEYVNSFIENCDEMISFTINNIKESRQFLEHIKCQNITQE